MAVKNEAFLHFVALNFLILGGLIWGVLGLTGYNFLSRGTRMIGIPEMSRIIYQAIGIATLLVIFRYYRHGFLMPHLGETVFPRRLINFNFPLDYNQEVTISAPKGATYVVYWTTLGHEEIDDGLSKKEAYGDYSNSGAVEVQEGEGKLRFRKPARYTSRMGITLKPHVHYRWGDTNGKLSAIETIYV